MSSKYYAKKADVSVGAASRRDYAQDKVREGETGNPSRSQPGLPGTGREGALGYVRYIAKEHMEVRRDCLSLAQDFINRGETPLPQGHQHKGITPTFSYINQAIHPQNLHPHPNKLVLSKSPPNSCQTKNLPAIC